MRANREREGWFLPVNKDTADTEETEAVIGDLDLDAVEGVASVGVPLAPHVGRLADSAVTAAGHVTQHPVELKLRILFLVYPRVLLARLVVSRGGTRGIRLHKESDAETLGSTDRSIIP